MIPGTLPRRRRWVMVAVLAAGSLLEGCAHTPPVAPAPTGPLGPEVQMEGYAVRPPVGLTLAQTHDERLNATRTFYLWTMPKRADGSREEFQVEIVHARPGFVSANSNTLLGQYSARNARNHAAYVASPFTAYAINGIPFVRYYWKGTFAPLNNKNHGFVYVTTDRQTVIYIRGNDAEPYYQGESSVCESAAFTFRR